MYGRRLNMRRFFQIVGTLLMVFAAGLLGDAVQNLQELGWLPWLTGWGLPPVPRPLFEGFPFPKIEPVTEPLPAR